MLTTVVRSKEEFEVENVDVGETKRGWVIAKVVLNLSTALVISLGSCAKLRTLNGVNPT